MGGAAATILDCDWASACASAFSVATGAAGVTAAVWSQRLRSAGARFQIMVSLKNFEPE